MQREDWFWLAIKVAGVWLLMEGVLQVPDLLSNALGLHPWAELRKDHVLAALVPMVAGVLTLLHGHLLVPVRAGAAAAPAVVAETANGAPTRSARAAGHFWVASKVAGIGVVALALFFLPVWVVTFTADDEFSWRAIAIVSLSIAPLALFGLWLALGERFFRLATRGAEKSLP